MNARTNGTKGARLVARCAVSQVLAPAATPTWTPVSHDRVLSTVGKAVEDRGLKIVGEQHFLGSNGNRYWGRLKVAPARSQVAAPEDYSFFVGVRNSLDKSMAAAIGFGTEVFICSNGCFSAEFILNRKHTPEINHDLPRLIGIAADRFNGQAATTRHRFDVYKNIELSNEAAHDLIIRAAEGGVTNYRQVPTIVKQWKAPDHYDFRHPNVWRLFNAFTEAAKLGSEGDLWERSVLLQGMLDTHCRFNAPEREVILSATADEIAVLN